jgi:hypothetical protein
MSRGRARKILAAFAGYGGGPIARAPRESASNSDATCTATANPRRGVPFQLCHCHQVRGPRFTHASCKTPGDHRSAHDTVGWNEGMAAAMKVMDG